MKVSLRNAATDYYKNMNERLIRLTPIDEYACALYCCDTYFLARYSFSVLGHEVIVEHIGLGEALLQVPKDIRDIILAYYFLDMSDARIGLSYDKPQRTVNYMRHKGLRLLREVMTRA